MSRPNRSVACLCVAVVALAAFLPGVSALQVAVLEPHWVLLPDQTPVPAPMAMPAGDEQTLSLVPVPPSRGPPFLPLA